MNKKKPVNKTNGRKSSNRTQPCKQNKKDYKMTNSERAEFDDMNQIEWFPVDPYCD